MRRFRDLVRAHKKAAFGLWMLALVGVVGAVQWRFAGGANPIRTLVLGASTSLPPAPSIDSGPSSTVASTSATFTYSDTQSGAGFQCKLDSAAFASCAKGGVTYTGLAAGSHTFQVEAQQGNGPLSAAASRTWTVVVPPPPPTITSGPASSTIQPDATFVLGDSQSGVTFQCALDGAAYVACTSPASWDSLAAGSHTFSVQAISAPAVSAATSYNWTISGTTFGIVGDLTQALYPGATVPLNLTFTNPYSSSKGINVTAVTVTVQHGTVKGGQPNPACDGPANVTVTNGTAWPLNLPRNATTSLSQLNVPQAKWPQVTMLDLPSNQDACKATTFKFSYTGTATK